MDAHDITFICYPRFREFSSCLVLTRRSLIRAKVWNLILDSSCNNLQPWSLDFELCNDFLYKSVAFYFLLPFFVAMAHRNWQHWRRCMMWKVLRDRLAQHFENIRLELDQVKVENCDPLDQQCPWNENNKEWNQTCHHSTFVLVHTSGRKRTGIASKINRKCMNLDHRLYRTRYIR